MARLSQSAIKEKADEWASLDARVKKATEARDTELQPLRDKFAKAVQPILEHHEPRITKLTEQRDAIAKEIIAWLESKKKAISLSGNLATAANETKIGARVINPQKFFDFVKEKTADFWDCVTVGVQKAEQLVGKKVVDDKLSTKPTKLEATLKLNPKE